jgi:hypothetical protein
VPTWRDCTTRRDRGVTQAGTAWIGRATSNGSVLKNLARTLEEASAERGMSSASLLDHLTPDSEAMRDLDLVVSVSTVANDPIWLEEYRGEPVLDRYWDQIARGGLDELRVNRRAILAPLCDGDAGGGRYQLTDEDLVVTGSLASYRIDLATANVRMEGAGKWLSFDTKLTPRETHNHYILGLPAIDDDEILHRILIRAAILADDEHLASRKLLKQIRG